MQTNFICYTHHHELSDYLHTSFDLGWDSAGGVVSLSNSSSPGSFCMKKDTYLFYLFISEDQKFSPLLLFVIQPYELFMLLRCLCELASSCRC